jgi:large subunit ribosomal protein L25
MPTQPLELRAEPRTVFRKHVRRLRREGIVPANIFGHGESRAIQASLRSIEHLLARGGRTGLISLSFDGGTPQTALMKDIQRDPRSGKITHIEFQAVALEEEVTSVVPLRFVGESVAVTKMDGVMTHPIAQLKIQARAVDLPDVIEVDVTPLEELHASIKVADLPPNPRYRVQDPPDEVLAVVLPPKIALELEAEAVAAAEAEAEARAEEAEAAPEAAAEVEAEVEAKAEAGDQQPSPEQPRPEAPAPPKDGET